METSPTPSSKSPSSRYRRYTVLGVSAGLLGGGAIGLAGTLPFTSQAAEEIPSLAAAPDSTDPESTDSETTDPTTTETDDTSTDDTTDDTTDDSDADEQSRFGDGWLRDTLQPLVDDGTLTSEQLDSVLETLDEARPAMPAFPGGMGGMGRGFPGGGFGGRGFGLGFDLEVVADALGIEEDALADELADGQSIADVAADQGVDVQVVIDVIVADAQARIDEKVAEGDLDEDDAAEIEADLLERVDDLVNGELPARPQMSQLRGA